MPEFLYEGRKGGIKVRGKLSASSRSEAVRRLRGDGILPLEVKEERVRKPFWKREFHLRKPSDHDLSFVLIQIGILLESGVQLSRALELVSSQVEDQRIGGALLGVKSDIERGESLSRAFARTGLFPEFFTEMLTAAETGENLEKIFQVAGEHLETVAQMKGRILSAVTYPAVVILMSMVALLIAIKFVVPKIAGVLTGLGKDLPLITKLLLLFSKLVGFIFWLLPLLLFILLFLSKKKVIKKRHIDSFLERIPAVGKIRRAFDLSRFAYTLYITLSSAVPMVRAYDIAVGGVSDANLREELRRRRDNLERGESLSSVLRSVGSLPPLFLNLIETGESSGELERMLRLLSEIYRREAIRAIELWVRLVEPLSILIIGIVVGIIAVSVILPLTEVTSNIGR